MDAAIAALRPPGPAGLSGRLAFLGFGRDPLGFVETLAHKYPGAARLALPGTTLVYLFEPDAIGEVLLDRGRVFTKDWTTRALGAVLGQGLFTSEGDFWRRQRGLVTPPLQRKQIAGYVDIAAHRTRVWLDGLADGKVYDLKIEMTHLTMAIVAEALFGADIGDGAQLVASALDEALRAFEALIYTWRRFLPDRWEQPVRSRIATASRQLDDVVGAIITRKRAQIAAGVAGDDLLSRLILVVDDGGAGMTDQQLRDEAVTMLLAGHETTAMALSFAFSYLARQPTDAATLQVEADRVLGPLLSAGAASPLALPTAAQVPSLVQAAAVFKEALRLRPPVWLFGREAQQDCVVGRWQLRAGEQVLITPWVMHQDPRWFDRPRAFIPARWLDGLEERLPRHVYLPFGGGQRICAGLHFAAMEGAVILAMTAQALIFEPVDLGEPALSPAISLRAKHPLRLRVRRRQSP